MRRAEWFETLPDALRLYTPTYMGRSEEKEHFAYRTEYLRLSTLSELLVFGRLPAFVWNEILDGCDEFLTLAAAHRPPAPAVAEAGEDHAAKTLKRLEACLPQLVELDLDRACRYGDKALPSLRRIVELCDGLIPAPEEGEVTVWHGDFCFSNIFYDFRAQQIKVIDPRGRDFAGRYSIYGDRRYDLAKLSHSVVGQYDFIIAGHYDLKAYSGQAFEIDLPQPREIIALQSAFQDRTLAGTRMTDPAVSAMTVLLFLSMLPLHDDNPKRQRALLANGLRLFAALDV
ncbi:MAG: phosphotransferase [Sphingomonas sp.]